MANLQKGSGLIEDDKDEKSASKKMHLRVPSIGEDRVALQWGHPKGQAPGASCKC